MRKTTLALLVLAFPGLGTVRGADVDPAMGIFEGSWTDADGNSGELVAKIAPWGKRTYSGWFAAEVDGQTFEFPLKMQGKKEGATTTFTAEGEIEGIGKLVWSGKQAGDTLEGEFETPEASGTLELTRVTKKPSTLGKKPPAGAVVLFDGKNLKEWSRNDGSPAHWQIEDGAMVVSRGMRDGKPIRGSIMTKKKFGDMHIHIEFQTPYMPLMRGQMRGNSGVYVQGRYEVQVLDSFSQPPRDNEAGGIYKIATPLANASLPPGQWQAYDIDFRAARFEDGKMTEPARLTVRHNDTVIHDDITLDKTTPGGVDNKMDQPGGLLLQDHGNPVRFRNVWIVPKG